MSYTFLGLLSSPDFCQASLEAAFAAMNFHYLTNTLNLLFGCRHFRMEIQHLNGGKHAKCHWAKLPWL